MTSDTAETAKADVEKARSIDFAPKHQIRVNENAQTKFMANTKWVGGAYSKTRIRDFMKECDEPKALLGTNWVPNPVKMILAALGSCLAVGFAHNKVSMLSERGRPLMKIKQDFFAGYQGARGSESA